MQRDRVTGRRAHAHEAGNAARGDFDRRGDAAFQFLRRQARRPHGDEHLDRRDIRKGVDREPHVANGAPTGDEQRRQEGEQPLAKREVDQALKHETGSLALRRGQLSEQGQKPAGGDALAVRQRPLD